ncbi:unnamed protein product [Anisakis simplex]|uniref:LD27042p (inferred by orthology to a D. melanogaster protein) n=1 Tax=Anisakis simplex TaxID=6269 RepID=A0A0M3JY10_ANISI|nr:unnamed protein product [Anisakis simplex]
MLALMLAVKRHVADGYTVLSVLNKLNASFCSFPMCVSPRAINGSSKDTTTGACNSDPDEVTQREDCSCSSQTDRDIHPNNDTIKVDTNQQKLKRKWMGRRAHAVALRTRISRLRSEDALEISSLQSEKNEEVQRNDQSCVAEVERDLERRANEMINILRNGGASNEVRVQPGASQKSEDLTEQDSSIHVNRYRKIIYSEGELDSSDLSLPPSSTNPHPFDPSANPSLLPPTHSRALTTYVNHLALLQNLVHLGVDLLEVDTNNSQLGRHLIRLDWNRDVRPKLEWLLETGVPITDLGSYLTRNPFFLIIDLDSMKVRVNYLRSKKFTKKQIVKIITEFRYWLNTDVRTMDSRLGWIQKSFSLSADRMRSLIVKEPRIVMFGIAPLQRISDMLLKEMEFSKYEVKKMLLEDPRLFLMDASHITMSYAYLHYTMGLQNAQIANYPLALRCSIASIRRRHEYLVKLKRNNYIEGTPDAVSLKQLLHPSDRYFAVNVARTFLVAYNQFLKT